jgi:FKBP-type peptidyl-prolyl cis-trans isomerase 2
MAQAKNGDKVKVHYTGRLGDDNVFDSSREREPLEFQLGNGQLIPGFEEAVIGMNAGETKTFKIQANEAYGEHREELVQQVPRQQFPSDMEVKVGQRFQINQQEGEQPLVVTVTEVSDTSVTIDANHPLAGEDLTFDIELVEIL